MGGERQVAGAGQGAGAVDGLAQNGADVLARADAQHRHAETGVALAAPRTSASPLGACLRASASARIRTRATSAGHAMAASDYAYGSESATCALAIGAQSGAQRNTKRPPLRTCQTYPVHALRDSLPAWSHVPDPFRQEATRGPTWVAGLVANKATLIAVAMTLRQQSGRTVTSPPTDRWGRVDVWGSGGLLLEPPGWRRVCPSRSRRAQRLSVLLAS